MDRRRMMKIKFKPTEKQTQQMRQQQLMSRSDDSGEAIFLDFTPPLQISV